MLRHEINNEQVIVLLVFIYTTVTLEWRNNLQLLERAQKVVFPAYLGKMFGVFYCSLLAI